MTKKINPNLTAEQKLILFKKEQSYQVLVNLIMKKEKEVFIVQIVEKNYLIQKQNMRVVLVGPPFMSLYQMCLKQKQITI